MAAPRQIARHLASLLALASVALLGSGCSNEAESVVETWEELGSILEDNKDDCAELAEELTDFSADNQELFSPEMTPIYDEIAADPELRFRMERAFATIETTDFECRDDPAVQKAATELFGELLEATKETQE